MIYFKIACLLCFVTALTVRRESTMAVSYDKLFILMHDKKMKRKDLIERAGISYATIAKLKKGDNVQMEVLEKICRELKCQLSDIAEIKLD